MKQIVGIALVLFFGIGLTGCNKDDENRTVVDDEELNLFTSDLIAVSRNDEWGYVNSEGEEVIDMGYDGAGIFMNDVALVKDGEGYKLINVDQEAVSGGFDYMERDQETGLVWFVENSKVGLMNDQGEVMIEPVYDHYYQYDESYFIETEFSEGYALVMVDGDYGLIDDEGETVVEPGDLVSDIQPFSHGRALFYDYDISKSGYMNTGGDIVIEALYEYARPFDEFGHAIVRTTEDGVQHYHLIDTSGDRVIEEAESISHTVDGYLVQEDGSYHFIDGEGARYHEDGFASVSGVHWSVEGFYVADGQIVDAKANVLHESDEGVDDYVQDRSKLYLVEALVGEVRVTDQDDSYELTGDAVEQIVNSLAVMERDGQYGAVNFDGELIVPFDYNGAVLSHDGFLIVHDEEGMIGLFTTDGTMIFDCIYEDANLSLNP